MISPGGSMDVNHDWTRGKLWLNIIILSFSFVLTEGGKQHFQK